eukprot:scaffold231943_cov32-Tisochrysis_lutea.AAC.2
MSRVKGDDGAGQDCRLALGMVRLETQEGQKAEGSPGVVHRIPLLAVPPRGLQPQASAACRRRCCGMGGTYELRREG